MKAIKSKYYRETCEVCGFKLTLDLHHQEGREYVLCPNHHCLITRKIETVNSLGIKGQIAGKRKRQKQRNVGFAKECSQMRHSLRKTQQEMADIIGIASPTWWSWERGVTQATGINSIRFEVLRGQIGKSRQGQDLKKIVDRLTKVLIKNKKIKPKYQITMALTEEEKDKVERLRAKGITLIEIFRTGLGQWDKGEEKE